MNGKQAKGHRVYLLLSIGEFVFRWHTKHSGLPPKLRLDKPTSGMTAVKKEKENR